MIATILFLALAFIGGAATGAWIMHEQAALFADDAETDDAEIIAAKDEALRHAQARADVAEAANDDLAGQLLETRANLQKSRRVNDENVRIIHSAKTVIERRAWLPTVEGNYLDLVANLPVGWRLDLGWSHDETPIGAGVADDLADVVPLRGRS